MPLGGHIIFGCQSAMLGRLFGMTAGVQRLCGQPVAFGRTSIRQVGIVMGLRAPLASAHRRHLGLMNVFVGDRFSSAQPTQSLLKLLDAFTGGASSLRSL